MYSVLTSKEVKKFLAKHPELVKRFVEKSEQIEKNPYNPVGVDIKPYIGHPYNYRLRIGKYRFLYEVLEEEILIYYYDADSRGDIYK